VRDRREDRRDRREDVSERKRDRRYHGRQISSQSGPRASAPRR
jgi:hypothetical protein